MASVSSLDKDLRNLRLSKYTQLAANEAREWIEEVLHEKLPPGDLLDVLKDGITLCRLINLAVFPGIKYKQSSMPFVQMENISLFLRACQAPPLSLPPHDVFLTVDLYEAKDPAQVLQCLGAFSRRMHGLQPAKFPRSIGTMKTKGGVVSPQLTGSSQGYGGTPSRARGISNVSESSPLSFNGSTNPSRSGPISPTLSPRPAISSWSKKSDEESTAPAWNIHQYGYMGGASQGNQGISFGARRQITTPAPPVPSLAEKERLRRVAELEQEQLQANRQKELEAEEERAKLEEERLWREETERLRERERCKVEEEKKQWDEERRRWEEEEQRRLNEEKAARQRFETERHNKRTVGDTRLNGQFLSQYQAIQKSANAPSTESQRVKELEQELELAKEREQRYERERLDLQREKDLMKARPRSRSRPRMVQPSFDLTSQEEERKLLRSEWQDHQSITAEIDDVPPPKPPRPLPEPSSASSPRPLPDPAAYANKTRENRTDRFLSSNPAPVSPEPVAHQPQDYSSTAEIDAENSRRIVSTQKTRAGGWASKTLLEREMERERERQREWEESQKQTQDAVKRGLKESIGIGPGQGAWDVHQYGFLGGDNQNRGGPGLGIGGAKRQIIGPRPRP
ncbi:hypothetical protein V8E54_003834 [Elaphomyces granulatus]